MLKSIEEKAYRNFLRSFYRGEFGTQRLGQAFFDHFKLHKMNNEAELLGLYEQDGEQALNTIRSVFDFM